MLPLELRKYLFDIAQACDLLTQFTGWFGGDEYGGDGKPSPYGEGPCGNLGSVG